MVDRSDYLVAVQMDGASRSGTRQTINMAIDKGISILIIDPIDYTINRNI